MSFRRFDGCRHECCTVEGAGQCDKGGATDAGEALDQGAGRDDAVADMGSVAVDVAKGGIPRDTALEGHGVEPFGLA